MLSLRTRRRVQKLLKRHSRQRVADMTGVSLRSVSRIAKEPPVRSIRRADDAAERKRRKIGRPSEVAKHRRRIERILERNPEVPVADILRRLRKLGYRGGQSAVYDFVAALRY